MLGDVVDAQSGELAAPQGGGEPDEAAVVDPAPCRSSPRPDRGPPSGSVSAADVMTSAQDRRVDQATVHNASIPRSSSPNGDHLAFVQLALSDPASANKLEDPGSCDPRVGRQM